MTLAAGTRLGPYEIESAIGAGGFGEVYKARDTRLGRLVALKVLLPVLAGDATFRERFEREARAISQLTHPHICTLYDVGRHEGNEYLVMEYLEGETLDARLKGRAIPVDEAMRIGGQIADALVCAHGAGIMHRDLKPANVFLTKTGVKLLDFGLAKAAVSAGPGAAGLGVTRADTAEATPHPTLTAQGTILGTLQYMAPEQVEGVETDSRVDIWAFGAILHEMIAGKPAFEGRTPATLIAAVLMQQPQPLRQSQPQTPRALERIIEGCLEKDREQRWQSIRDVKRQLAAAATIDEAPAAAPPSSGRSLPRAVALAGGALVLAIGALASYGIARGLVRSTPSASPVRFEIRPPAGLTIPHFDDTSQYMAPSPDGTRVAFLAGGRLWIKALDRAAPDEIAGTTGAESPFWSPDGRSIAFFGNGQLKKKVLDGGPPQVLCPAAAGAGANGTWSRSGVILFDEWGRKRMIRVSDDGGTPVVLRSGSDDIGWPQFLPDGRHYLYAALSQPDRRVQTFVGVLDSNDSTALAGLTSRVEYVSGHLLFRRDGTLVAQPFDPDRLRLTGTAVQLAELVSGFTSTGFAAFSATPRLLVYQAFAPANRLVWTDREGRDMETIGQPRDYASLRLSPDGSSLAVTVRHPQLGTNDIWVHDFRRNIDSRATHESGSENGPIWSPDGRTIVYSADRRGPPHLHAREVNGSNEREVTPPSTAPQAPTDITPDGRFVIYADTNPEGGRDVVMAPLAGKEPPLALVHTKANEAGGRASPDGKWLAYQSNESGRGEVYVRPFRDDQTRRQISRAGGANAKWRADGRELFYVEGGARIVSVDVSTGVKFEVSAPRVLFSRPLFFDYDASADGRRFVFSMLDLEAETGTLSAILNWTTLLRK